MRFQEKVCFELIEVGMVSAMYVAGNVFIILFYVIEIGVTIYYGIKIDKDNRLVDNNRIVLWWKQKERERSERQFQRFLAKHKVEERKVELTEEQKLKKMSRKQRKEYKRKKK